MIRCRLAQLDGTQVTPPLARFPDSLPWEAADSRLRRWLGRERPDRIVALRPLPGSRLFADEDYRSYNAWQLGAVEGVERLAGAAAARLTAQQAFPAAGIEVLIYAPVVAFPAPT